MPPTPPPRRGPGRPLGSKTNHFRHLVGTAAAAASGISTKQSPTRSPVDEKKTKTMDNKSNKNITADSHTDEDNDDERAEFVKVIKSDPSKLEHAAMNWDPNRRRLTYFEWLGVYDRLREGIDNKVLKKYKAHSKETYGEVNPKFILHLLAEGLLHEDDVLLDVGCALGNVLFQVASMVGCRAIGIEIRRDLYELSSDMLVRYKEIAAEKGLHESSQRIEIHHGDAVTSPLPISDCTIIFMNNVKFTPEMDIQLMQRLKQEARHRTKIITTRSLWPRPTQRSLSGNSMWKIFKRPYKEIQGEENSASWDSKPLSAFVFTINNESNGPPHKKPEVKVVQQQPQASIIECDQQPAMPWLHEGPLSQKQQQQQQQQKRRQHQQQQKKQMKMNKEQADQTCIIQ
ncbi:hypothetical protein SAMD00019534_059580 [Acytostelium subglobosum LB1]|uniref:hypothetical protein n=1 Tax=Acytostelium subglobosum LB1 TaxID=1410327 RepID=UPI000644A2A0|nr:hypothetical protein SAMD00019534_059580 [Acytostelium subglobosum LB1]GAM22783.1 hypothetical protein SAMD00019534_059580 [Acytostelium subglobosum LB1]|eukprot:XP_012754010.1 hypothetical protein SAMD00019534_059580 [Acytostelium subglobosum LB1]